MTDQNEVSEVVFEGHEGNVVIYIAASSKKFSAKSIAENIKLAAFSSKEKALEWLDYSGNNGRQGVWCRTVTNNPGPIMQKEVN